MNKGTLFILSGPSGVGKTTVEENLVPVEDIFVSVSATTRPAREGEIDGEDYIFLTEKEFRQKIENEEFLEWAEVHGNFYGTPQESILSRIENGLNALLVIDVQGAKQVRKKIPASILIFLLPPSMNELKNRLEKRATDEQNVINSRMTKAAEEITSSLIYDYSVVNHSVTQATDDVAVIIRNCKSRRTDDR